MINLIEVRKSAAPDFSGGRSPNLSVQELADILEDLGDGLVALDRSLVINYWNKKASRLLGHSSTDMVGRNFLDVYGTEKALEVCEVCIQTLQTGEPVSFEDYLPREGVWLEVHVYPSVKGLSIYFKNISDRKREEQQWRIANERYEFVSQATSDIIWDWNLGSRQLYLNQSFTRILGYEVEERTTPFRIWSKYLHPDDKQRVVRGLLKAIRNPEKSFWTDTYTFIKPDGTHAILKDRAVIMRNGAGQAVRMIGAAQDITAQREVEQELQRNERRFRAMVQSGLDVVMLLDKAFSLKYVTPNIFEITGHDPEQFVGLMFLESIHPEDLPMVITKAMELQNSRIVEVPPYRYFMKGAYGWVEATLTNYLKDPDIASIVVNVRDITQKKKAMDGAQLLSLVAEQTVNAVVITDAEERITWVNKAFTDITEYGYEEATGKRPGDLLKGPHTSSVTRAYLKRCIEGRQPFNCEILNYTKSGRPYWMEIKGQPIFDAEGKLQQFFAIQTDITARKEIEETIRLSEEKYKLLFYGSPVPKYIYNYSTLRFTDVNDAAVAHYGYTREEFLSMDVLQLRAENDGEEFFRWLKGYGEYGERQQVHCWRHLKKDGTIMDVEISIHALELPSGCHIMAEANDITEKLKLEKLVMEEKLATQKEIAQAIINTQEKERSEIGKELHDNVNQLLTTTKLYIENIKYYPEQQQVFVDKSTALVQKAITEIRYLSKALVTPIIYDIGFKATLDELIEHYLNLEVFAIRFEFNAEEEKIAKGMKLTIYRIVQEQLNNIVKYAQASSVVIQVVQERKQLKVLVSDNGVGFDPAIKKSGLGLNNIQNRAQVFKGIVDIRSAPGEGCAVQIIFPS